MFFAKEKSKCEVINDLRGDVVNFYKVCQREFGILKLLIDETVYSRQVHREAEHVLKYPEFYSEIKWAWAFWVQANMSFASKLFGSWGFGKSDDKTVKTLYNKRSAFTDRLRRRLDRVQIEQDDALKIIKRFDTPDTFFYLDPPYYQADMGHYGGYTEDDFRALLEALSGIKGKFLLSSYPGEMLDEFIEANGWDVMRISGKVTTNTLKVKKEKVEVLTANYELR